MYMYQFIIHLTSGFLAFATTIYKFKERFEGIMHNKTKNISLKISFVHNFEIMIMLFVMSFIRKSLLANSQHYTSHSIY